MLRPVADVDRRQHRCRRCRGSLLDDATNVDAVVVPAKEEHAEKAFADGSNRSSSSDTAAAAASIFVGATLPCIDLKQASRGDNKKTNASNTILPPWPRCC